MRLVLTIEAYSLIIIYDIKELQMRYKSKSSQDELRHIIGLNK